MKRLDISHQTPVSMPMKNLISIIMSVAVAVWAYFGIIERLNNIETSGKLMIVDVEKNTEFRIKWPRGELGSLPADSEQFLLIEDLVKDVEKIQEQMESMMHNKVNIERLQKDVEKTIDQLENLKDKVRANGNGH